MAPPVPRIHPSHLRSDRDQPDMTGFVSFGPFNLSISSRLLLRDGEPIQIGSRALDILITLISSAGEIVNKREIIERVWSGTIVDEGNLRVHMAGLRKVLGDGRDGARYVANVPGRGYSFVAPIAGGGVSIKDPLDPQSEQPAGLPPTLARMVGREEAVQFLASQVVNQRFVSVVGPGGIGKTTVAIAASHRLRSSFGQNIRFLNLGVITDPRLVHVTIASMLGVNTSFSHPVAGVVAVLQQNKTLIVLDSCEHLIEPVAALAAAIFEQAPLAHLITTTREALRVEGEHVTRLAPLECPPEGSVFTAAESLVYPAVELFVERAAANATGFTLTDGDAPLVADICRKLDGIALAIELGAGRVEAYGLDGTAQLLDSRLGLLWQGRRTAPPRHQTLNAMLDWSYSLLPKSEQAVLRRLAVFAGPFTLDAAQAVATDAVVDKIEVVEIVAGLVAKSLVSPTTDGSPRRYRLLDTTRAYALEKLAETGSRRDVAHRHAQFFAAMLRSLIASAEPRAAGIFIENLDNIRSALEWSFSENGDASIGVALAAHAASFFLEHSLLSECHRWAERAIACLDDSKLGSAIELELQTSLGWSAMFAKGKSEAMHGAFLRALEIAESLQDIHRQLRLLGGLNIFLTRISDFNGALILAQRGAEIARQTSDSSAIDLADWMLGVCHHLCGHQTEAETYCSSAANAARRPSSSAKPILDMITGDAPL